METESAATLLTQMATLDLQERQQLAVVLGHLSDTFGEVSDGKTTAHVLGVLAHLIDPP